MVIKISANKYQLYGRIIAAILFASMLCFFTYIYSHPRGKQIENNPVLLVLLSDALMVLLIFTMVVQILFLPISVNIDADLKEIEIKFLLLKPKTFLADELAHYGNTIIYTKSSSYEGLLLHTTQGESYLLSDFNLKDYKPIISFLEDSKIDCIGKEKFRFFSYYYHAFKRR